MKVVRVLFVVDTLEVGGAEQSMLEMAPYFRSIELAVCHVYAGDHLRSYYEQAGIVVYSLGLRGSYEFLSARKRLSKLVDTIKPDIIHSALLRSSLIARVVAREKAIPIIGSFVSDAYGRERYSGLTMIRKVKLTFFRLLDRITSVWVYRFISISETVKVSNAKNLHIPLDRIIVIYRGRRSSGYCADELRKPSKHQDPFTFISVGRLVPSKGHSVLIEAMASESLRGRAVKLKIVGDGPLCQQLQAMVRQLNLSDRVELLGYRSDIAELLSGADAFLFPSFFEGLGGSVIEAMMAGLPIVCSDLPVFKELIVPNVSGLFAKPGEAKEWARVMSWIIVNSDEASILGVNARETARGRFEISNIAEQYERVYCQSWSEFASETNRNKLKGSPMV